MRQTNKLFLLLALLLTAATGAWAEEQVVYTLDGTQTASNTNYATAGVVTQGGITWMVTGNVSMNPWRIGGKSLSGVDRSVWSENSLDGTVTKVTLEFGEANSITVNSITMMVASDADFNNVIDTKGVTFSANNTVDVTPTEGKEWKDAYYLFVFNVSVSGSTNRFFQLKSIKFYNDPDAQQQGGSSSEPVAGTYTVSLKDGVKDAGNWSIEPKEGLSEGDQVTIQYNGRLKVKGVKATSDAAAAEESDLLSGVFSVSSTKKVNFSKGNLQATYNGTDWTWAFAENQWDYIGNAAGNTSINGNGTVSASNVTVDLFGWVGASSTWTGAAQYGISNSTATDHTDGYGNAAREALKSDWGNTIGTGWFTLSSDEWQYLFNTRTTGGTVFGTEQASYAQATINTDGTSVKGMILFPDGVSIASTEVTTAGSVNATSAYATKCTTAQWAALAAKGCVFLPAAGNRNQASVYSAGSGGYYWSSSPYTSNLYYAYRVIFLSGNLSLTTQTSRYLGYSVRLVQEVAPNP